MFASLSSSNWTCGGVLHRLLSFATLDAPLQQQVAAVEVAGNECVD